jgi:hypothetical protein
MDEFDTLFEDALKGGGSESAPETADSAAEVQAGQESPAAEASQQGEATPAGQEAAQKEPMPPDQRARQAEGRRIREREARAYQAGLEEASRIIREAQIANPAKNGAAIDNLDELRAYNDSRREKRLQEGKPTASDIEHIVDRRISAMQQPQQQETPLSAEDQQAVQQQLAEIRAMDPAMTGLPAILDSEAGPKFREYVALGLDFKDAYTLAAKDRLASIGANRSGARTGGKDHLSATRQQGSGGVDVPADEMALMRALNPDMSDTELRQYYEADKKKFGR